MTLRGFNTKFFNTTQGVTLDPVGLIVDGVGTGGTIITTSTGTITVSTTQINLDTTLGSAVEAIITIHKDDDTALLDCEGSLSVNSTTGISFTTVRLDASTIAITVSYTSLVEESGFETLTLVFNDNGDIKTYVVNILFAATSSDVISISQTELNFLDIDPQVSSDLSFDVTSSGSFDITKLDLQSTATNVLHLSSFTLHETVISNGVTVVVTFKPVYTKVSTVQVAVNYNGVFVGTVTLIGSKSSIVDNVIDLDPAPEGVINFLIPIKNRSVSLYRITSVTITNDILSEFVVINLDVLLGSVLEGNDTMYFPLEYTPKQPTRVHPIVTITGISFNGNMDEITYVGVPEVIVKPASTDPLHTTEDNTPPEVLIEADLNDKFSITTDIPYTQSESTKDFNITVPTLYTDSNIYYKINVAALLTPKVTLSSNSITQGADLVITFSDYGTETMVSSDYNPNYTLVSGPITTNFFTQDLGAKTLRFIFLPSNIVVTADITVNAYVAPPVPKVVFSSPTGITGGNVTITFSDFGTDTTVSSAMSPSWDLNFTTCTTEFFNITVGETTIPFTFQPSGTVVDVAYEVTAPVVVTLVPTYSIYTPAPYTQLSGTSRAFNITTNNVPNGTTLYFTRYKQADETVLSSGTVTINNDKGTIIIDAIAAAWDFSYQIRLYVDIAGYVANFAPLAYSSWVSILPSTINTSTGNPISVSTYSLNGSTTLINGGESVTITLATTNVSNGTLVPYYIVVSGLTGSDVVTAPLVGNFTVTNNTASVVITTTNNPVTKGGGVIALYLRDVQGKSFAVNVTVPIPAPVPVVTNPYNLPALPAGNRTTAGVRVFNNGFSTGGSVTISAGPPIKAGVGMNLDLIPTLGDNTDGVLTRILKNVPTDMSFHDAFVLFIAEFNSSVAPSMGYGLAAAPNYTGYDAIVYGPLNVACKIKGYSPIVPWTQAHCSGLTTFPLTSATMPITLYAIATSAPFIQAKGTSRTFTITTTNIPDGTVLVWGCSGRNISNSYDDSPFNTTFITDGNINGNVTISNNVGVVVISLSNYAEVYRTDRQYRMRLYASWAGLSNFDNIIYNTLVMSNYITMVDHLIAVELLSTARSIGYPSTFKGNLWVTNQAGNDTMLAGTTISVGMQKITTHPRSVEYMQVSVTLASNTTHAGAYSQWVTAFNASEAVSNGWSLSGPTDGIGLGTLSCSIVGLSAVGNSSIGSGMVVAVYYAASTGFPAVAQVSRVPIIEGSVVIGAVYNVILTNVYYSYTATTTTTLEVVNGLAGVINAGNGSGPGYVASDDGILGYPGYQYRGLRIVSNLVAIGFLCNLSIT